MFQCPNDECESERFVQVGDTVVCKGCGATAEEVEETSASPSLHSEEPVKVLPRSFAEKYLGDLGGEGGDE